MGTSILQEALEYARRGWYVFPCREKPGESFVRNGETIVPEEKTPYVAKGLNDASIDEDQIKAWWSKWPSALIGVNAGLSGLFVVDIDKKHGVDGYETFTSWGINDSAGLHSFTPSGGAHVIFTGEGKSSANSRTGIDTRGVGGYFIAPPSKILKGEYVGEYKTFDDWGRTPGVIPDGLLGKIFPDNTTEYVRGNSLQEGKKQLSRTTLNFLASGAPEGERNTYLFKVLADFCGCEYTKKEAKDAVWPVCVRIGLDSSEFEKVLEHAYSKSRTPSIPDAIQERIASGDKNIAGSLTIEEQEIIETALLACMLIDNSVIPAINDILGYSDFQVIKNRIIYKAINRLYNSGTKVDLLTTSNEVGKETNKIKIDDISNMINQYYTNIDNAVTYATIIKEKSLIRKIEAILDNKEKYISQGNIIKIVAGLEKDITDIALEGGVKSTNVMSGVQAVDYVTDRTRKIMSGEIKLLPTGFTEYDKVTGGLFPDDFVVLAGRSGDGKSAMALSILNNIGIKNGIPCVMFSLEMSTHETVCRLIGQLTGIEYKKAYMGRLTREEWVLYEKAVEQIKAGKLFFDDSYGMSIREIRSKIRKLIEEKDIKLIVIDQLEQIAGYDSLAPHLRLDKIAYEVKNLVSEFKIPIILNHQLNRGVLDRKLKNPEPQMGDLNQAGEKPATQVWAIAHLRDEQDRKKILQSKIAVLKNRNGATLDFPVVFVGERMLFSNPMTEEEKHVFQSKQADITCSDDDGHNPFGD